MASWHRFFLDFGRFWEASWEGNRSQDRPKKASKNDAKKKSNEIAKKVAIRISNPARDPGSWVLGIPLIREGINSRPPGRSHPHTKITSNPDLFDHRLQHDFPPHLRCQNEVRWLQKLFKMSVNFLMPLVIDLWKDSDGILYPQLNQVGTKIRQKIDINFEGLTFPS